MMLHGGQRQGKKAAEPQGFTMLELLFVIAILAIIAAMAIPSYISYTRNYRIRNDANSIAGMLSVARMRAGANFSRLAVSCNPNTTPGVCKVYSLQFSPGLSTAQMCGSTPATAFSDSGWKQEPQQYTLSSGVKFSIPSTATVGVGGQQSTTPTQGYTGNTATPYIIYYNSRGWPVDCTGSNVVTSYALYLQDYPGVYSLAVAVDASGRPHVWSLGGSSYWEIKD